MLTSDVKKYIQTQFENKLTSEEVVEDLVKGGWRESDAKTVVRQYETRDTLDHLPPKAPSESKKKSQKIDFSQVASHGDKVEDEAEKDFIPEEDSKNDPPKIHQETEEKPESVIEQKEAAQNKKRAKAEELLSSASDLDASYDDLTMKMAQETDRRDIHQNGNQADTYQDPVTTFNPIDLKPQKAHGEKEASHRTKTSSSKVPGKKRVFVLLTFLWILMVGFVVFLYMMFVQTDSNLKNKLVPAEVITQNEEVGSEVTPTDATCESDINCFVQEGSKCLTLVSVEKMKVNSFFASKQKVKTFLEVIPQPEGDCLFTSKVVSVDTEFTGDVAGDTKRNIQAVDKESVGLEGACLVSSDEIGAFLEKLRDGSLSDLDTLSAGCEGSYYEQDSVTF